MPSVISLGNVVELKTISRQGSQNGINVSHWTMTGGTGASLTDQVVATKFSTDLSALYRAYMSANAEYLGLKLQIISPDPAKIGVIASDGTGAGSTPGDALPPQVAMIFTKQTALAGRSNRGRMYLPFWAEIASDGVGQPNAGAQALAAAVANYYVQSHTFTVGPDSTTLAPVIWHKKSKSYSLITTAVVRGAWATQRRRSLINKADAGFP